MKWKNLLDLLLLRENKLDKEKLEDEFCDEYHFDMPNNLTIISYVPNNTFLRHIFY